jgi:hypothetical protein
MSLSRAVKYYLCSRIVLPLAAVYAAGFALGRVIYFSTGHLFLFSGPLGDLRRGFLANRPFPQGIGVWDWTNWLLVVVLGGFVAVELARQRGRRVILRQRLLVAGYVLMAAACSGRAGPEAVKVGAWLATGVLLALARWTSWRRRERVAAVATAVLGVVSALSVLRLEDAARLG